MPIYSFGMIMDALFLVKRDLIISLVPTLTSAQSGLHTNNMNAENVQSERSTEPCLSSSRTEPEGMGYERENHRLLFASRILNVS